MQCVALRHGRAARQHLNAEAIGWQQHSAKPQSDNQLTRLGALRNLDLQLLRVHQELGGHAKAARRHLQSEASRNHRLSGHTGKAIVACMGTCARLSVAARSSRKKAIQLHSQPLAVWNPAER